MSSYICKNCGNNTNKCAKCGVMRDPNADGEGSQSTTDGTNDPSESSNRDVRSETEDWRDWFQKNHPELDALLHEYRKTCWSATPVNKDYWAVERKILALMDRVRISELDELYAHDQIDPTHELDIPDYIEWRKAQLKASQSPAPIDKEQADE